MLLTSVSAAANAKIRKSTVGTLLTGNESGTSRASQGVAKVASNKPAAPPAAARTRFSVSNCRSNRSRPAPMAMRTAISRRRVMARDRPEELATQFFGMKSSRQNRTWRQSRNVLDCRIIVISDFSFRV